jgi:uroporphyrin-III C-methyltransferase
MNTPRQSPRPEPPTGTGFVSIVGAGPGDPELITVKGLARLREADVVAYDRLAPDALLAHCRPGAELIYVGKHGGPDERPSTPQGEIEALLVSRARAGLRVVRLKGGDPFVFGRGGEEALALRDAGVPFEVVPGLSSALAVPAYAGVPLTHRGLASSFAVVTGHGAGDGGEPEVDLPGLALAADTLVVLMGVRRLETIVALLLSHGRPAGTPALIVERGSTGSQRSLAGTLGSIAGQARTVGIAPPATLVVGEVVRLREALAWFPETIATPPTSPPATLAAG